MLTFAQTDSYSFVMVIIPTRDGDREKRLILSVSRAVFENGRPKYGSDYFHSDTIQQSPVVTTRTSMCKKKLHLAIQCIYVFP
jgi:hypothetical protein